MTSSDISSSTDGQTKAHTLTKGSCICSYVPYLCNLAMISYIGAGSDEIYGLETTPVVNLKAEIMFT